MEQKSFSVTLIICTVILCMLTVAGALFLPSWGKFQVMPIQSVTVVGEAKLQTKTQIAMFSAGVNAYNDDKQAAVDEVNRKVAAIVEAVKQFGVLPADLQTQNMNIYQNQESFYEDGRQKFRPGQWNVGNTISIKLRNVDQASTLANILSKSGATNVNGPSFTFDDTTDVANSLMADALKNAGDKAGKIAAASGRKLGKVVSVTEGYTPVPMYMMNAGSGYGGGGGGAPVESGSGTVTKTVTVTYELE